MVMRGILGAVRYNCVADDWQLYSVIFSPTNCATLFDLAKKKKKKKELPK